MPGAVLYVCASAPYFGRDLLNMQGTYLEWNRVRPPLEMRIASFVAMSSASICAISSTMSSTAHSSYRVGKIFGGCWSVRGRLEVLDACRSCPAGSVDGPAGAWGIAWLAEPRRL